MSRRLLGAPGSHQAGYREPCLDPDRFRETAMDPEGFRASRSQQGLRVTLPTGIQEVKGSQSVKSLVRTGSPPAALAGQNPESMNKAPGGNQHPVFKLAKQPHARQNK